MKYTNILLILLIITIIGSAHAALTDNLYFYYKLDEPSGTTVTDIVGNNNGTNIGATVNQAGKINTAYGFQNQDNNITNNSSTGNNPTAFTYCFWFNKTSELTSGTKFFGGNMNVAQTTGFSLLYLYQTTPKLWMYAKTSGADIDSGTAYSIGTGWHYICYSLGADGVKAYVDATVRATWANTSYASGGNTPFKINGDPATITSANGFTDANIDEVGLWSRQLSDAEITTLYNGGAGLAYPFGSTPSSDANITFNVYQTGTSTNLSAVNADWNVNTYDLINQTSPWTQDVTIANYSVTFSRAGYDNNTITIVADSNKTITVYLTDSTPPNIGTTTTTGFTFFGGSSDFNLTNIWDYNNYDNGNNEVARKAVQVGQYVYVCGYINDTSSLDWRIVKFDINGTIVKDITYNQGGIDICDWVTYDGNSWFYNGYYNNAGGRAIQNRDSELNLIWSVNYGTGRFNSSTYLNGYIYATGGNASGTGYTQKVDAATGASQWVISNTSYMNQGSGNDGNSIYVTGRTAVGAPYYPYLDKIDTVNGNLFYRTSPTTYQGQFSGVVTYGGYAYVAGFRFNSGKTDHYPYMVKINTTTGAIDTNQIYNSTGGWESVQLVDNNYLLFAGNLTDANGDYRFALITDLNLNVLKTFDFPHRGGSNQDDAWMSVTYNGDGNTYFAGYQKNNVSPTSIRDWSIERAILTTPNASYIIGTGNIIGGTATDAGTGIDTSTCQYTIDNGSNWLTATWSTNHCEKTGISVSAGTTYKFNTRVKDLASNQGTGTATPSYIGLNADINVGQTTIIGFTIYNNFIKGAGNIIGGTATQGLYPLDTTTCQYTLNNGVAWGIADWNITSTNCQYQTRLLQDGISYTFNTRISDTTGNVGTGSATSTYIGDTFSPSTTISYIIPDGNNTATITLICTDLGSGCASTKYMFDSNGTWYDYNSLNKPTFTELGQHYIDYNSTDNIGNVETTKRSDINMPVLLTIKYPKNITTLIQLTEKWALRSVGGVIVNITDLTTDQNLYVAPNILTTFYISDVNGNYTQSTFTKTYYNDSSNGTTDILQAYLYNINSSLATTINVLNKNTLAAIPNITIKFYGNLPGLGNIFIGQGTTDSKGQILQLFTAGQSYVFDVYNGSTFLQSYNYTAVTTQAYIYFNYLNIDANSYPTITPIPNSDLNSVLTQFYVFRNTLFTSCTNEDPCFPSALIAIVLTIIALIAATSVSVTGGAFVGIKGLSIVAFCCFTIFLGIGFLPMFIYAFLGTITLLMAVVVQ